MEARQIYITELDIMRLQEQLFSSEKIAEKDNEKLTELEQDLLRAEKVPPREISDDVIIMNSTVWLRDLATNNKN